MVVWVVLAVVLCWMWLLMVAGGVWDSMCASPAWHVVSVLQLGASGCARVLLAVRPSVSVAVVGQV